MLTDRQTSDRQGDRRIDGRAQKEKELYGEKEEVGGVTLKGGVDTQLSLTGGSHGERAVLNSRTSNGRRRCLCHHGDGAVPREVVMG